jgi:hypothetical protein
MNQSSKGWEPGGGLDVVQEGQPFCPLYYSGKLSTYEKSIGEEDTILACRQTGALPYNISYISEFILHW